jgi:hypothetical protein
MEHIKKKLRGDVDEKAVDVLVPIRQKHLLSYLYGEVNDTGIRGNIQWEELTCVGYNPTSKRLEAIVHVKQTTGYSGGLCTPASKEHVRFFIDWQNNNVFEDLGLNSFKVADIPDSPPEVNHPLHYMAYIFLDDAQHRAFCSKAVMPRVRAILSWNSVPGPDPNQAPPAFGNILDARIQLAPRPRILFKPKFHISEIINKYPDLLPELIPQPWHILKEDYRKQQAEVPDHRIVYPEVHQLLFSPNKMGQTIYQQDLYNAKKLDINLLKIADILLNPNQGNTTFEELTCVGLNASSDTLGAVIKIKKPSGYSGNLCSFGSVEYVSFWIDWDNNGAYDAYVGTAAVQVHDILNMPAEGLHYCVSLPVDLSNRIRKCSDPNIIGIRAVLSWAVPPSTTNPDAINYWGNRLDAKAQIRYGGNLLTGLIFDIGGVHVENIDPASFYANPGIPSASTNLVFGAGVRIGGAINNSGPPGSLHFRVEYSADAINWSPVTTHQTFNMEHFNDIIDPLQPVTIDSPDGWFPYLNKWDPADLIIEQTNLLALWDTGTKQGVYHLRLAYTTDIVGHTGVQYSTVYTIILDNTDFKQSPLTTLGRTTLDLASTFDIIIEIGGCVSVKQGELLKGKLRVIDTHFGLWTLTLEPSDPAITGGITPLPTNRPCVSLVDNGDGSHDWTLNTAGLKPCGYTVTLRGYDRAIVNGSLGNRHQDARSVGFAVLP